MTAKNLNEALSLSTKETFWLENSGGTLCHVEPETIATIGYFVRLFFSSDKQLIPVPVYMLADLLSKYITSVVIPYCVPNALINTCFEEAGFKEAFDNGVKCIGVNVNEFLYLHAISNVFLDAGAARAHYKRPTQFEAIMYKAKCALVEGDETGEFQTIVQGEHIKKVFEFREKRYAIGLQYIEKERALLELRRSLVKLKEALPHIKDVYSIPYLQVTTLQGL